MAAAESIWARGSNVEWCEAVAQPFRHSPHVAEFWNTISNAAFLVIGAVGLIRAWKSSWAILYTEAMLLVVGVGSCLFHSRRTWVGEVLDELPMSAMALGYLMCLDGRHVAESRRVRWGAYLAVFALTGSAWVLYLAFHQYEVFTTLFTLQVLVPALLSLRADRDRLGGVFSSSRGLWWAFFFTIILGKGLWELERYLHRRGACPRETSDPRFWLHPLWHLLSATAHGFWMRYANMLSEEGSPAKKGLKAA